jgi:hypothetical protein
MALKPFTMSFKETNPYEVKLHEILSLKTSPMAFAKDILIEVLVRKNNLIDEHKKNNIGTNNKSEIEDIFDI